MKHINFHNNLGSLTLTTVSKLLDISKISLENQKELIIKNSISIDDAEIVTLITENNNIQIVFPLALDDKGYILYHKNPNEAYICSVEILDVNLPENIDAQTMINLLNN